MSSPTANEAAVREAVRSIIAPMPIDKIVGQPSNSTVNVLKQQLAKIAAAVKTTSWGGRHAISLSSSTTPKYQAVTNVPTLTTTRLVLPPIVPANLANNTTLTHRTRIMADHNLECQEFWKQESVGAIIVDKIPSMQRASKNFGGDYIGYGAQTTKTILEHLRTEWCVVTTLEKKQASAAFHVQWDLTSHITKFARNLTSNRSSAETSAYRSDATKVQYYVEGMYSSDMFDDKEMQAWELKPSADKTWDSAKTHRHPSKEKFNAERIARTGGCDSANTFINTGSIGSTSLGTLSPNDHQTILEYTNSLETALEHTQEHAAILTTTQDHRLKQLETQQQELLSQTTKFMALLTAQQSIPTPGTTTGGQQRTARRQHQAQPPRVPATATRARKPHLHTTHAVSASPFLHTTARPTASNGAWHALTNPLTQFTHSNSQALSTSTTQQPTCHPAPSRKVSTTVPSHQQSATLAPPPQQAPYMTHSSTLRPAPPKYLCYRQEPPPQPQSKHSSSSMYVRPPTQSTLYQTFTKHYSVVANSLTPTTQPVMRQTRSQLLRLRHYQHHRTRSPHWLSMPTHRPLANSTPSVTVNDNTDTLILDSKCGLQSTHPRYHVPTPTHIREHLQASLQCNTDHILNVYELPSIEQSIRYLHAAAGFPTKSTWLAAIRKGTTAHGLSSLSKTSTNTFLNLRRHNRDT
eukprot:CCRYP_018201-RA/>CCRYP_018201-RA protein AED:0.66 eAED:0.37 QI:0/0/0/0.25/0/0/4/0/691